MAMVSDAANGAAPAELRAVCSAALQVHVRSCDGFASVVPRRDRRSTERGEGCEGSDAGPEDGAVPSGEPTCWAQRKGSL